MTDSLHQHHLQEKVCILRMSLKTALFRFAYSPFSQSRCVGLTSNWSRNVLWSIFKKSWLFRPLTKRVTRYISTTCKKQLHFIYKSKNCIISAHLIAIFTKLVLGADFQLVANWSLINFQKILTNQTFNKTRNSLHQHYLQKKFAFCS